MSRAISTRGRHTSSTDTNFYACYGEYAQQYIADRQLLLHRDSTASLGSVAAIETAQIQLYLKKPEVLRSTVTTERQRPMSKEMDDRTNRSFLSLSEDCGRNSRVVIVHPAKKSLRQSCSSTYLTTPQTSNAPTSSATSENNNSSCSLPENSKLAIVGDAADDGQQAGAEHTPQDDDRNSSGPESNATRRFHITRLQSLSELFWQGFAIDDVVYCGAVEASQNSLALCRLNIEYIVDLSGADDKYFKCRLNECPCPCSRTNAHTRMVMTVSVLEEDPELPIKQDLVPCFADFIAMINKAKARHKCVLVFSKNGRNRAPAFSAAYLMHEHRYTRIVAVNKVAELAPKTRPGICISDALQRALMRWQRVLGIRRSPESNKHNNTKPATIPSPFAIKRSSWM